MRHRDQVEDTIEEQAEPAFNVLNWEGGRGPRITWAFVRRHEERLSSETSWSHLRAHLHRFLALRPRASHFSLGLSAGKMVLTECVVFVPGTQ